MTLIGITVIVFEAAGILSAIAALLSARTSQGAIAWVISLVTFPYVAVPLYWIFGRSKFEGYTLARTGKDNTLYSMFGEVNRGYMESPVSPEKNKYSFMNALEKMTKMPVSHGNETEVLISGDGFYDSIFNGIDEARSYILAQFYIIRDDDTGTEFARRLKNAVKQGVKVTLLYDEIGSSRLPHRYLKDLKKAGVVTAPFNPFRIFRTKLQINFRNHRKIMVVDGKAGWTGGFNIGDEYRGRNKKLGGWRDTHVKITGPAVLGLQVSFFEDWHWATDEVLQLDWSTGKKCHHGNKEALIFSSGPADKLDTAWLMFQHIINSAKERVWITSPYFVPDDGIKASLQLAVLRGVDVRILVPDRPDHLLVYLSSFAFIGEMIEAGVKLYRYKKGFLHQKVFLADSLYAGVGTANLDNRSFRLNFEVTAIFNNREFNASMEKILINDIDNSELIKAEEISSRPFLLKVVSRAAYLLAPIQ